MPIIKYMSYQKEMFFCFPNQVHYYQSSAPGEYLEDISLDDISRKLHISKNHVSYLFNKKLNIQFSQYINSLRVNKACSLMGTSDKSLTFISEEAGFGSIRSFNRAFKQIMGICPLEYYKQINSFKQ